MSKEEILNNAFALGNTETGPTEKVYDLMISAIEGDETTRICVGSWTDEEKANAALHTIFDAIKSADKVRGLPIGLRVYDLSPEEKTEYLGE